MDINTRNLLILFLRNWLVTASWGISDIAISDKGIAFSVDAMKYKGRIEILPASATDCTVCLQGKGKFLCSNKTLIHQLDRLIEHCDDYSTALSDWLNL